MDFIVLDVISSVKHANGWKMGKIEKYLVQAQKRYSYLAGQL
jgi:hypothetical protein